VIVRRKEQAGGLWPKNYRPATERLIFIDNVRNMRSFAASKDDDKTEVPNQ
jgi:hypothetical protein